MPCRLETTVQYLSVSSRQKLVHSDRSCPDADREVRRLSSSHELGCEYLWAQT